MAVPEGLAALLWTALCTLLAPALLGAGVVRWLGLQPGHGWRRFAAFAYLTGHCALAPLTLLWLCAGKPVPGVVLPALAAVAGVALLAWRRPPGPVEGVPPAPHDRWLGLLCLLLAAVLVDHFLAVGIEPITAGDDADIWAAKAKVMFTAPGFDLRTGLGEYVLHADYPLLNPLVQVLSFASADRVLQFENRLPIQAFGIALLLLLSAAVQRASNRWLAAGITTAFAATSFFHCTASAYADVMVALGLLAAVDGLQRYGEGGEPVWWRLSCVGLALLLASKNEGALLAVALVLAVALAWWLGGRARAAGGDGAAAAGARLVPPFGRAWGWLAVPAAAVVVHRAFNWWFDCRNDLFDPRLGGGHGLLGRIPLLLAERALPVAQFYGRLLLDPAQGRLLVLLFLLAVVLQLRRLREPATAVLVFTVVFGLCGYMLVFVGTYFDLQWHLLTAADRTVLHLLPVAALGLAAMLAPARPPVPGGVEPA